MSDHMQEQVSSLKPQYDGINLDDIGLTLENVL